VRSYCGIRGICSERNAIKKLDPKQIFYISCFPVHTDRGQTKKPEVIIDDLLVTRPMEVHGFVRKYPKSALFYVVVLAAVCFSTYKTYTITKDVLSSTDKDYIDTAFKGFIACVPYVVNPKAQSIDLEAEINKGKLPEALILQMNKVTSVSDLYKLDKVVLCK